MFLNCNLSQNIVYSVLLAERGVANHNNLYLSLTFIKMVDRKRIELFPKACKAPVLPLSPTAHIYKDLKPIHSVCQIKKSTLPYPGRIRPGQTYRGVSCPSRCWSQSPTRTLF